MKINKKIKVLDFKLSKILNGGLFGAYKSKFSGNGLEFSEHKEYHFGDHVKDIDWKASNKTNNMFIKKYEEERELNVLFILDNSISMKFGSKDITKKDILEEVFYSLSLSAYYNNDNIGGIIFNEKDLKFIDYKKSRNNIYKMLNLLESRNNYKIEKINKFDKIFKYLLKRQVKNNLIFILTDETDNIDKKLIKLVGNNNEIVYINIFDVFENDLIDNGINIDINLNLGNNFLGIDLGNSKKIREYKVFRKNKIRLIKESFSKNKVGYIYLDTNSDIFSKLLGYFSGIRE